MTDAIRHPVLSLGTAMLCWLCVAVGCGSDEKTSSAGAGGSSSSDAGSGTNATGGSTTDNTGGAAAVLLGGGPSSNTGGSTSAAGGTTAAAGTSAGGMAATAGVEAGGAATGGKVGAPVEGSGTPLTCPDQGDLASWLPSNPEDPCTKGCGPDKIGYKTCSSTDEAVCTVPPCAVCDLCIYPDPMVPCYETPNDPALPLPPECPEGTVKSDLCEPACDGTNTSGLCLHVSPNDPTKMEGCVCAERGKWACATYNTETNTWN